jgi:hypothetical protein
MYISYMATIQLSTESLGELSNKLEEDNRNLLQVEQKLQEKNEQESKNLKNLEAYNKNIQKQFKILKVRKELNNIFEELFQNLFE